MNRRIAAWTIAAVAVLGLTACSGAGPSDTKDDGASDSTTSETAPAEQTETSSADQSVTDACQEVSEQVSAVSSSLSGLDVQAAQADPQGTVDRFSETVDAFGASAEAVGNIEVKEATSAVFEDFGAMRDLLSRLLIDQDQAAATEMLTVATDVQASITALGELCTA